MSLILETLSVSVLSSVDTATVVVVLRSGRRRPGSGCVSSGRSKGRQEGRLRSPVAIGRHDIVDLELLTDLLNSKVESVRFELFAGHIGNDGGWEAHEAGGLVLGGVAPSVALLAAAGTIGIGSCKTVSILKGNA